MTRRAAAAAGALATALAAAVPAAAVPCALDEPPAATLLLPYFEVDLDGSLTTLLSVGSASSQGALARVTLWSDLGVPVFWFDLYLTGWDVQTINLRDVLAGVLPQTAPPAADPGDTISPQGEVSFDTDFPGCSETMPPTELDGGLLAHLRAALSGQPSPLDPEVCYGADHGDGRARGWATVDVVERCGTEPPGVAAGGAEGLAMDNVLWGDFLFVDPDENLASAFNLVRLEAAPELLRPEHTTFYSSKLGDGSDAREPLPSVWALRYVDAPISGGTSTAALYWRDPGAPQVAVSCALRSQRVCETLRRGTRPVIWFDEEENATTSLGILFDPAPPCGEYPFDYQAGRVEGVPEGQSPFFQPPFDAGWAWVDLGFVERPAPGWTATLLGADGRYSAAIEATPLDAPCGLGIVDRPLE